MIKSIKGEIAMNFRDLEIIKTLDDEKNITSAATKLYVSQPSLSYKINTIEQELGVSLIIRTKKGIRFTPQGDYLVDYAKKTLNGFNEMKDNLHSIDNENEGVIRLGVSHNLARYDLPELLSSFTNDFHKIQFKIITSWSQSIYKLIASDEVSLAIVRGDVPWKGYKILLDQEPICIISKDEIDIEKLPSKSRIAFKTDIGLQNTIDKWWKESYNEPPNEAMLIDNLESCLKLVEKGMGYAIAPNIGIREHENLNIVPIKNKKNEMVYRDTWLLYREEVDYPLIHKFIRHIKAYYKYND
ncbi:LysR family transcriptional regulator [Staphylococcus succinus]|uniref:LysR family transcriptional regulator n=2 Tax=Staphylococcus succinus TaxID=61015 RepID=A0A9Q6MTJ4_9STAP|nr:LysR family transcriptional regulator [Staphylococcus succinus]PTJ18150.1 LysR family transcriptional regulator [Staphylococcus succinus]RIN32370.1 LysR family transcriptional regulator [Staphylococcus succinus]